MSISVSNIELSAPAASTNIYATSTAFCTCVATTIINISTMSAQISTINMPGLVGVHHPNEVQSLSPSSQVLRITTTICTFCPASTITPTPPKPVYQLSEDPSVAEPLYLSVQENFIPSTMTLASLDEDSSATVRPESSSNTIITETMKPGLPSDRVLPRPSMISTGDANLQFQGDRVAFLVPFVAFVAFVASVFWI
jgi:hypothetical protein